MTDTVLVGTQAVIIEGYLDGWEPPLVPSPLVDAGAMPARPGFWPAFLYAVGLSKSAAEAFDDDLADVSVLIDELVDPTAWPVLSIRLHRGHLLHIVMRNFPDDAGVDFVIAPPVGGRYIPLAAMEGSSSVVESRVLGRGGSSSRMIRSTSAKAADSSRFLGNGVVPVSSSYRRTPSA